MSEVDIKDNPRVENDPALNLKAAEYTMGLRWYANISVAQFDAIRATNGNLLSYGAQVQIYDYDEDTPQASFFNIIGISFRLDDRSEATMTNVIDNMYGISFVKLTRAADLGAPHVPDWYKDHIHGNTAWDVFSVTNAGKWFVVLWKRIYSAATGWSYAPLAYQKLTKPTLGGSVCDVGTTSDCTKIKHWATLMVYITDTGTGNNIRGYLASTASYPRNTTDAPQTILWAETAGAPNTTVPDTFHPISWTVVGSGTVTNTIQDSSLTTINYNNSYIGDITKTKAREIGLHIFDTSTSAQNIFYDNFFIDLAPSGYGFVDGSGRVVEYP